ncbi:MAG: (Fe-S)-binding protein [Bacteroidia bacterium]|nr:(Fe-S)-binding protein [Bacteroidia bacterium]
MVILGQILFVICLVVAGWFFSKSVKRIRRNILLGKDFVIEGDSGERLQTMLRVAFGQSKILMRIIPGILHLMIYLGFLIINTEMLEIMIDGIFGTHRILSGVLGPVYPILTAIIEFFMLLVLIASIAFWVRRNVIKVPRFTSPELTRWPLLDANIILYVELALITALFIMNTADQSLQKAQAEGYHAVGSFPLSSVLVPLFSGLSVTVLTIIERGAWWVHVVGILIFLNYIPRSKHLHIFLAFPTTYFSKLKPKGQLTNMASVTQEVKLMLDPSLPPPPPPAEPIRFGAKDVFDLNWKQLLEAYSCTECGRCTSSCPANITGKKLSPRKVMMDTRDRLEEVGLNIDQHGKFVEDGKTLLGDYITPEEVWACTTCNACTEACPVNLDPVAIIMELRRFMVMEESKAPEALNAMFTNVENNGAPWAMPAADRFNWASNS